MTKSNISDYCSEVLSDFTIQEIIRTPSVFKRIENKTPELCEIAIQSDPFNLEYVKNPTLAQCQYCFNREFRTINYIPLKYQTIAMYEHLVSIASNGITCFKNPPIRFCEIAINKRPNNILLLKRPLTFELFMLALNKNPKLFIDLRPKMKKLSKDQKEYLALLCK